MTAYILVQTEVGKAAQVARDVVAITGVQQAEDVTGPYDVIVRAEARSIDELGRLVVARACRRSTASPGPSPVRWCTSRAARHLLVDGRQQHGRIAAGGRADGVRVKAAYERL